MIRNKRKILILPGNEIKTSQQLLMLQIDHQLPLKEVEIDGILHQQLTVIVLSMQTWMTLKNKEFCVCHTL